VDISVIDRFERSLCSSVLAVCLLSFIQCDSLVVSLMAVYLLFVYSLFM